MMTLDINVPLPEREREMLDKLVWVYTAHAVKNAIKLRYYNGDISLHSVNLGIALPQNFAGFSIGCHWGANAVDVLAARSVFDGYVNERGEMPQEATLIATANNLNHEYSVAVVDELMYGCTFATLSADVSRPDAPPRIRFHSPKSAAAVWDGEKNRIAYGLVIVDYVTDVLGQTTPSVIHLHTDTDIWVLRCPAGSGTWSADRYPHRMGRPLMEPLIWNATTRKRFGQSRLKRRVRDLIDGYIRTVANATIGLEFATSPQKYLLGVTDAQYEALINDKFKQYVGSIIAATTNPMTGQNPLFGQLPQGSITPHVEMMRMLATQFAAATGLSVTDTGVVNTANPSSSDAILAQTKTLVGLAEKLNEGNGAGLKNIMLMALAIQNDTSLYDLPTELTGIIPHFKNPSMPSTAQQADAALKIASMRQSFAQTDVFLEMVGFSQADIRRIKAQESLNRGLATFMELEDEDQQ